MPHEPQTPFTPKTPGEVLKEYIFDAKGITQDGLARALGVSRLTVNQLVNGKRSITAEMALRLERVLGTTAEFWLNLQRDVDLALARRKLGSRMPELTVLHKTRESAGQ
jgi:addiction module HigA family antidote